MEILTLQPNKEDAGSRVDAWLAANLEDVTRSAAQRLIEEGRVSVGGRSVAKSCKLGGGEEIVVTSQGPRILVSFGIFSVIRIVRAAQLLVNATDYSVPDKECNSATSNDNPCEIFRHMEFPVSQFRGADRCFDTTSERKDGAGGGCGCHTKN